MPISFFALSLTWLVSAFYISRIISTQPLWIALICTVILGAPIFAAGIYSLTIKRIQRAEMFQQQGILHWLMTGRIVALVGWTFWSLISAFFIIFYLGIAAKLECWLLFLSLPVFIFVYKFNLRFISREFKAYIATHLSLVSSRLMFAIVMAFLSLGLLMLEVSTGQNLNVSNGNRLNEGSLLISETLRLLGYFDEFKRNALDHLLTLNGSLYSFFVLLGSGVLFFNIALVFSSFIVPANEYRRLFSPLQNTEKPQSIAPEKLLRVTAIITFTLFFLCVPATAYLELWLQANPRAVQELHAQEETVAAATVEILEKIGDGFYQPGTIEKIAQSKIELINQLDWSMEEIEKQSELGYQLMTDNVDHYLDWYYSLGGEYTRLFALLNGEIETLMATELQEQLMAGNAFAGLEASIKRTLEQHDKLNQGYQLAVGEILQINKVEPSADKIVVQEYLPLISVLALPEHAGIQSLQTRLLVSGAAGAAITGAIAAKVTAKVIGKGTLKIGAKALAKVAAGKASSAIGGTAIGAALGSIVPGIGTVIGGVVGGIIGGVVVGLTVEQLLLLLEEAYSRDEFKREIIESIDAAKLEFQSSLL